MVNCSDVQEQEAKFIFETWPTGLVPWCSPIPATPFKKQCFVQKELDQFNMQNMYKTVSKIKANAGSNLGENATEIQWQYNKPNNGSSQYSVMTKGN